MKKKENVDNKKVKFVTVRYTEEQYSILCELAEREKRTVSDYIRLTSLKQI